MPTEIVKLELEEVSLVDRGDDPLAKVAIFKRSPEGVNMENEELEAKVEDTADKGYKEDMKSDDMDEDDMEEMADEEGKKPTRKSWKAEAQSFEEVNKMLLEEVETLKGRIAELETDVLEKAKPQEETIEVEGEMIAKSAIPTPILKKLEELQKAQEVEALRKRADEILPNFKGTADQRGKLLKSVGDDEEILSMLKAADAIFAEQFKEVGKVDPGSEMKTAKEQLDDMVEAYQTEKGVDFFKAYAAVTKSAEGKTLLLKSYKDK